jgi:acyl carrier protein
MATADEVFAEVQAIARRELELTREVTRDDALLTDLELDSLSLTVLAVGLENRFRVKIPDEQAIGVRTVGDLSELVARLTAPSTSANPSEV